MPRVLDEHGLEHRHGPAWSGLGSVTLNGTITTPTSVTRQAVRIQLQGVEIVLGEAKADLTGNPRVQ